MSACARSTSEARALLGDPQAQPFEAVPAVSSWSPAQHFFHMATIADGVLQWIGTQCENDEAPGTAGGPNRAGYVVLLTGRIPRGIARTPSRFEPPERPERATLERLFDDNLEALRTLEPCLPRLPVLDGRMKHPHLGRLNPREWLRFVHVHTNHHQRIVRKIVRTR